MLKEGTKVEKGEPMFPRLDREEEVAFIKEQMQGSAPKEEKPVVKEEPSEEITIDDFMKVELRVAQVTQVEPVKKADKLLKLQLDLGYENAKLYQVLPSFISLKN